MGPAPRRQPVLLVDLYNYKPDESGRVNMKECQDIWKDTQLHTDEDRAFCARVCEKSGLGLNHTYLPPAIHPKFCADKPKTGLDSAAIEAKEVLCGALDGLLAKTGLTPRDIDILVTTCSIYCPTPSMASMVVNHFEMRPDIQSYHLGGMGCANGVIAVNLVADLLQAHPNANAVLLTTETVTPCYYPGKDKHRMVTNLLFRMGGAAMLFSNSKAMWGPRAKYSLSFNHRVHVGQSDDAYTAVRYWPDDQGINGIYLGKNVVTEASRALTKAMWAAGPHLLTVRQKAAYVKAQIAKRLAGNKQPLDFKPNFSNSVQHFLLHAGGAKVLDGLGKALQLTEYDLEPSRGVLHDYGNVSSSTTWYTLGYVESVRGVNAGDRVLQVGVGSGIKCGVNVWKALRNINDPQDAWLHRLSQEQQEKARRSVRAVQPVVRAVVDSRQVMLRVMYCIFMLLLAWVAYHVSASTNPMSVEL